MENVLKPVDLYATPDSVEALHAYLKQFHGQEATIAWTCAMMAWNLAAKLTAPGDES